MMIHFLTGNLNHGDDLGFVFGQNTITGEKIDEDDESDEADERVTEVFTDMIANFARSGTLNVPTMSNKSAWLSDVIPSYSNDTNSFVSITTAPKSMSNFR